jgi:four helix bundle protein
MINEKLLSLATDVADRTLCFCNTVKVGGLSDLRAQLRRSAVSVASNIAEGMGRDETKKYTTRGKVRFYLIAFGSLKECVVQLELLKRQMPEVTEVSALIELWAKVRKGMLFVIDGYALEAHIAERESLPWRSTGLKKLQLVRAIDVAVQQALEEFLLKARDTDDPELLKIGPTQNGHAVCFSLETFRKFLKERGRRISGMELISELRSLGWKSQVCRFREKTPRVWLRSSGESESQSQVESTQKKIVNG